MSGSEISRPALPTLRLGVSRPTASVRSCWLSVARCDRCVLFLVRLRLRSRSVSEPRCVVLVRPPLVVVIGPARGALRAPPVFVLRPRFVGLLKNPSVLPSGRCKERSKFVRGPAGMSARESEGVGPRCHAHANAEDSVPTAGTTEPAVVSADVSACGSERSADRGAHAPSDPGPSAAEIDSTSSRSSASRSAGVRRGPRAPRNGPKSGRVPSARCGIALRSGRGPSGRCETALGNGRVPSRRCETALGNGRTYLREGTTPLLGAVAYLPGDAGSLLGTFVELSRDVRALSGTAA